MNFKTVSVCYLYNKIIKSLISDNRLSIFDINNIKTPYSYDELVLALEKLGVDDYEVAETISNECDMDMATLDVVYNGEKIKNIGYLYNDILYLFNPLKIISTLNKFNGVQLLGVKKIGVMPKSLVGFNIKDNENRIDSVCYDLLQLINMGIIEGATEILFLPMDGKLLQAKFKINNIVYEKNIIIPFDINYKDVLKKLGVDNKNSLIFKNGIVNKKVFFYVDDKEDKIESLKIKDSVPKQIESLNYFRSSHLNQLKLTSDNRSGLVLVSGLSGSGLSTLFYSLTDYISKKVKDRKIVVYDIEKEIDYRRGFHSVDNLSGLKVDNADILLINVHTKKDIDFLELKRILSAGVLVYVFINSQSTFELLDVFVDGIGASNMSKNYISSMHIAMLPKLCSKCSTDVVFGLYPNAHLMSSNVDTSPSLVQNVKDRNIYGCYNCKNSLGVEGTEMLSEYLSPNKEFLKMFDESFDAKSAYNFLKSDSWEFILALALKEVAAGNISFRHVNEFVGRIIDTI